MALKVFWDDREIRVRPTPNHVMDAFGSKLRSNQSGSSRGEIPNLRSRFMKTDSIDGSSSKLFCL